MKYLSIIEALYLFYMFRIFKTKYSIHHPFEYIYNNNFSVFFKHPIGTSSYESKICPFGQQVIILLIIFLLYREFFDIDNEISKIILLITITLSLLNLNALIYLLPYIIIESKYFI